MRTINIDASMIKIGSVQLDSIVGSQISFISLGLKKNGGATMNEIGRVTNLYANKIGLQVIKSDDQSTTLIISLNTFSHDEIGDYDQLRVSQISGNHTKVAYGQQVKEAMLENCSSLFFVNDIGKHQIGSISIYQNFVKDFIVEDEDFPEDDFVLNLKIDRLLRIDLEKDKLLAIYSHDGKLRVMPFISESEFFEYLKITKGWNIYSQINYPAH